MLVDTHCHINLMVKEGFNTPLSTSQLEKAHDSIADATAADVKIIINVGTSLIESNNCVALARKFPSVFAVVGVHPSDWSDAWRTDLAHFKHLAKQAKRNKIIGIGECGMDFHYPSYSKQNQESLFRAQTELALEYNLPIVIHMRDATDETLKIVESYVPDIKGVFHCFSETVDIAREVISWGFVVGIGGAITYPKNDYLRTVVTAIDDGSYVLETDAPFMPPQTIRGKKNSPAQIRTIATYIADLKGKTLETIAKQTTNTVKEIFRGV